MERGFNRGGLTEADDRLPEFFTTSPCRRTTWCGMFLTRSSTKCAWSPVIDLG